MKKKRHPRTSGRVFSKSQYKGNMILVGIHKRKKDAQKKVEARKYRIDKSKIIKSNGKYKVFVHYK
jgi:hypothetical protein